MYILFGGHILQPLAGYEDYVWNFSHAFLLLSEDTTASDNDRILRGGPDGLPLMTSNLVIEVNQYFNEASKDHPSRFTQETGIVDWQNYYSYSIVDIGERIAENA